MADQQRKVSLIFEANTSQAKQSINDLVQSLQKIQSMPRSLIDPTGIKEASKAAMELQGHIQKAVNVDTGKLDLSRFATSLATSGKSLDHYRDTLTRIGPEGSAAFRSVLNSINNAEVSTVRLTKGMKDFLVTMKNTVKWQISSSMMHSFIATVKTAYGYAKSLDSSLNDIRIVTGQSAEQMAKFAEQANRSAKALSTTTTKYTEAALIFYQQGLNDKEVKERTDAVIKMANVTGEASKEVSSYMTAIWNNFDNGSKSLEYYADVITKLGAATAASSAEIAGGLEKFAAVGNTIGLSYEYATAMLTTIIDKTRQSEDVVGTALKTILARIQGLNLGETLDDGTTLNKYSEALAKVGVNIKDASGQIKNMDSILDELGSKWGTLSKDTQIGLAQVVGGVRQYNQIISLMSNWSAFKQNVNLAETSTGSLSEQADIYAESWEAARDRVRAAAEGIYDALINENIFIKLDDIFTHLLNGISGVVKGMGGMIPIIGTIGGFITQKFAKEMPVALNNMAQNLAIFSGKANNNALNTQREATVTAERMRDLSTGDARAEAEYEALRRVSLMREKLIENQHRMSSAEIEQYQTMIKNEEALGRIMVERQAAVGLIEKETQALKEQVALRITQMQAENAQRDFVDDGNAEEYKTSKAWDVMQAVERDNLEKQLLADEARSIELKKAQMGEGRTKKDREKTKRDLTAEEKMELQDIERRLKKYGTEGQRLEGYYNEIEARTMRKYKGATKEAATGLVDAASIKKQKQLMTQEFKSLFKGDQFSEAGNKVELLKQKFLDLKNSLGLVGTEGEQQFKDIEQVIVSIGDKADLTEDDIKKISAALDGVTESAKNAEDQATEAFKNLGGTDEDATKLIESGEATGARLFSADQPEEPPEPKIEDFSSKVAIAAEAMGTLMSAYGAVNAVMEAWNTLTDENATAMEKLGAAIGALVSITMVANSVSQLAISLKELETVKTMMSAAADAVKTASVTGLSKAYVGLSAAMKAVPGVGWALAAISVITALGVALANIDWRTDKQKEIDELTDKVKALDIAQQNLSQHISDIESAWDNYQNAVKALEACTTGTMAWNDALLKCNESVLALMALSPELAQFVQYNEDGSISLGGVDYEEYIAEQKRANMALTAQNTIATTELKKLELSDSIYGNAALNANISKYTTSKEGRAAIASAQESAANFTEFIIDFSKNFESVEQASQYLVDTGILSGIYKEAAENLIRSGNTQDIDISGAYMASQTLWESQGLNIEDINAAWAKNISLYEGYVKNQEAANHTLLATLEGYEQENLGLYGEKLSQAIDAKNTEILAEDKTADELRQDMKEIYGGEIEDYEELESAEMAYSLAVHSVTSNLELLNLTVSAVNSSLAGLNDVGKSLARSGSLAGVALNSLEKLTIKQSNVSQEKYNSFNDQKTGKTLKSLEYKVPEDLSTEYQEQLAVKYNEESRRIDLINLSNQIDAAKSYEEIVLTHDKEASAAAQGLELINSIYSAAENAKYTFSLQEQEELFRYDIMRAQLADASNEKNWYQSLFGLDSEKESLETSIALIEERFKGIADIQNRPILSEEAAFAAQAQGIISNWNPEDQSDILYKQLNNILSNIEYTKDMTATSGNISEIEVILDALANKSVTMAPPEGYVRSSELLKEYNALKKQGVYGKSVLEEDFDSSEELKKWLSATFSEEDVAEILKENPSDISSYIPKEEYANWVNNLYKTLGKDKFSEILNSLGTSLEEFNEGTEKEQYNTLNENIFEINRALNSGKEALAAEILGIEDTAKLFETVLTEEQRTGTYAEQWGLIEEQVKAVNPEEWYRQELLTATGADEKKYGEEKAKEFARDMKLITEEQFEDAEFFIDWAKISELFNQAVIDNMEAGLSALNKISSNRFKSNYKVDENGNYVLKEGTEKTPLDKLFDVFKDNGALVGDIDAFATTLNGLTDGLDTKGFAELSDYFTDMIKEGADAPTAIQAFKELAEIYQSTGKITMEDISGVLDKNNLSAIACGDSLNALAKIIEGAGNSANTAANNFDNLTKTLSGLKSLSDLTAGKEISEEDYESFKDTLTEDQQSKFIRSAGGYTFFGTEEDAKEMERVGRQAAFDNYYNNRVEKQAAGEAARIESSKYFKNEKDLEENLTSSNILSFLTDSNRGLYNSNTLSLFELMGIGSGEIEAVQKAEREGLIKNGELDNNADEETQGAVAAMIDAITAYLRGDFANRTTEEAQLQATSMQSTDELYQAVASGDIEIGDEEGQISKEQYDAIYNQKQLDEYETNFGLDKEELDDLGDSIQEMAESSDELADSLKDDAQAADEVAKELKRYDKALKSVEDNYEDWQDALESDNLELQAEAIGEMDKAYSDLLDLDYDQLSNNFLTNKDNLKLLKEAAEGSEEAYNALQEAAGKDILMQVGLDTSKFDEDKALIDAKLMEIEGKELEDIEVGARLNDQGFLDALTNMVNATGMSASQATDYLSSMGVDATVIENPVTTEEVVAHSLSVSTGVRTQAYTLAPTEPGGQPQRGVASYPVAIYTAIPVTATKETGAVSLQVTSAGKSSGGGFKHANSSGGGRRRRGGGGGGGGGGRRPTAETKKEPDKERYHTITNQLEDLTDAYDKVSKAADRAFGKARIKLLQDQRKELQKLAAAQQSYIDEINDYYKQDLSNLDQVSAYVGFNVQLDENGTITNFNAIQDAMWDEYNSHINDKDEVIDMDEEAWKEYEEEWQRIMDLITKYEETQDLRKEALQQLQDYINDIYDLQLEEVTYSVEIDIEASDYALEILDYLLKQVEDDAWSAAEAIAYMGEQAADFLDQSQTYNSGIADILRNHTRDITDANGKVLKKATLTEADIQGYLNGDQASTDKIRELGLKGEFTDEEIQSLKDYHSQLLEINQSLIDLREQVYDTLSDSFSKFNEELQDTIDIMEHLTNVTDSYRNIIDLVGKKNVGISNALLESFSQIQTNQAIDLVKAQKSRLDDLTAMRDEAEALRQKMLAEGNEKDAKEIEERIKEMNKQIREATEDYTGALEDALQRAEDQFKLHISNIIEDANQAFAGAMVNIQQLQDMFNLKNDTNDIYLEDFEKIYELNKLNRDITNSIDETSNIKAKEELAKLQAEINALEEDGVKVSQYQTEDLRRRYELKLAEIALNEAKDAKSQVQMTRDADGNWSYVYTADENQVAEAEQNYEDRLYELQRANADYINEMQDLLIQTEAELMTKIEEITNDQTLSLEEKQALIDEFTAQYTEKFNGYAGELKLVLDNNKLLYEDEWTAYSNLTGYKISADENYIDNFNETMLSTLTGFQTAEEFHQNFNDTTEMLLNESNIAFEEWENNIDEVFDAAGLSSEDLAETLEDQFNNISNDSEDLAEDIEDTGDSAVETFGDIVDAVDNWYEQYSATIDRVLEQNTALAKSFRELLSAWSDYQESSEVDDSGDDAGDEPPADEETPVDEETEPEALDPVEKANKYKKGIAFAIWHYPGGAGWGNGQTRRQRMAEKGMDYKTVQAQINRYEGKKAKAMASDSGLSGTEESLRPYIYKEFAFDTGGYTGSWGREGRWALLHEKEIVLNKEDTSNLLSAINMIRQISEAIDLNAYSSAGFGKGIGAATSVGSAGTLEQVVHVTAEFPNATNKDEIYAAFGEIINLASQYANRR